MSPAGRVLRAALPALLLLGMAVQLEGQIRTNSVTVDELAHLPAGWLHLAKGDFAVYHHNPPLLQELAALPLALSDVDPAVLEGASNRWQLGLDFMRAVGTRYHDLYVPARRVIAGLSLATGLLLWVAVRRTLGGGAAIVALTLFCFSPGWLAHGALVTTDAGFAGATLAVAVAAGAFFHRPEPARTALLGVALGFALLTKFTGLLLPPLVVAAGALLPRLDRREPGAALQWLEGAPRRRWGPIVGAFALALLVLNAGYAFQGSGSALADSDLRHPLLARLAGSPLGAVPLPLPVEYVRGFDDQYAESSGHFTVYLAGETAAGGWWYYYPAALLLKLPLPLFVLLGGVVIALATRRLRLSPLLAGCLGTPLAAGLVFVALTDIDLGVRYLLFLLPFLYWAAAHLWQPSAERPALRATVVSLLLWYAASSLAGAPHYLAYFSDPAGGWKRGHHWLADSNLDWGQDLWRLREAQLEGRLPPVVALSHFGLVEPAVYGVRYERLTRRPRAERVVISINHLLGISPYQDTPGVGAYRERAPVDRIGASLWVFERAPATR